MVTEAQVTAALAQFATEAPDLWRFPGGAPHPEREARAIVRFHLLLGVEPISDVFSSTLMLTVVERLAQAEERIARLEQHASGGVLSD